MSRPRHSSPRPALAVVALAVALFALAAPARAQQACGTCSTRPVGAADPCGAFLSAPLGGYMLTGMAIWPQLLGFSLTLGVLHEHRVGVEVPLYLPLESGPSQPFLITGLLARVRILREGLDEEWSAGRPAPMLGLDLHARVGVALVAGVEGMAAFAFGPAAELVLGGAWLVSFRPTIAVSAASAGSDVPVAVHPVVEVAIGWLPGTALR